MVSLRFIPECYQISNKEVKFSMYKAKRSTGIAAIITTISFVAVHTVHAYVNANLKVLGAERTLQLSYPAMVALREALGLAGFLIAILGTLLWACFFIIVYDE